MATGRGPEKIRVAILGAGIAGLTLLAALEKHPHIDVQLYEGSASITGESGANVGFDTNTLHALELLGKDFRDAITKAGAVPGFTVLRTGKGKDFGTTVKEHDQKYETHVCLRARLIQQLAALSDKERQHPSMRLSKVDENDNHTVTLNFENGTAVTVDALIGCDGIRSTVRKQILGADHLAAEPVFCGVYTYIMVLPMGEAVKTMTVVENLEQQGQMGWVGDGGFLMHDPSSNRETLQVVAAIVAQDDWDPKEWGRVMPPEQVKKDLQSWGQVGQDLTECFLKQETIRVFPMQEHNDAPTYVRGRLAVIGDAAHAMQPWQGAGAGQAIEDALTLTTLFGKVKSPSEIPAALHAYDTVRRPRAQRVTSLSRGSSFIMTGRAPGIGVDAEKLKAALRSRWDYILLADVKKELEEAERLFAETLWVERRK